MGLGLECALCWQVSDPNRVRMDLHEVLWWRSDVMSSPLETQLAIHDQRNCAFVHQECHPYVQSGDGQISALVHLIRYEGLVRIQAFNREMGLLLPTLAFEKGSRILQAWEFLDEILLKGVAKWE